MERIVPLDTDISPEAAVSGAIVIADEIETILRFVAMRAKPDGNFEDAGIAVVRFDRCAISKFGYPNDEAWGSIPRTEGLSYGCYEVLGSTWNKELGELNRYAFPSYAMPELRHFLFLFHDTSFECLAKDCTIEIVSVERADTISLEFLKNSFVR